MKPQSPNHPVDEEWAAYPSQVFAADFHRRRILGKPYESSISP
jgi:hypothetical protein